MNFVLVDPPTAALSASQLPSVAPVAPKRAEVHEPNGPEPYRRQQPAGDRRFAQRKRSDERALVVSDASPEGVWCTVRNTSSTGALIELPRERSELVRALPERFHLMFFSYQGRTEVLCASVRRSTSQIAVRYVSPFRMVAVRRR